MDQLPELYQRRRLRASGCTDDQLRRMLRGRLLTVIRRGAYIAGQPPDDRAVRHRLEVRAALDELTANVVVSHASAAVLHGLPTWSIGLRRVHVTRGGAPRGRRGSRLHVHGAPLTHHEIVDVEDVPVTGVARTVVGLARKVPFEPGVVVADAALAAGLVQPDELVAALRRSSGWPGVPAARHAVAFADGRSESVGESRSRVAIALAGLPAPVPQWEVRTPDGRLLARVDFAWPELATVGEFDGRIKYGRLLGPGQDAGEVVYAEKRREDDLRAEGLTVVRWGWADLDSFDTVAARIRRAFELRHGRAA